MAILLAIPSLPLGEEAEPSRTPSHSRAPSPILCALLRTLCCHTLLRRASPTGASSAGAGVVSAGTRSVISAGMRKTTEVGRRGEAEVVHEGGGVGVRRRVAASSSRRWVVAALEPGGVPR